MSIDTEKCGLITLTLVGISTLLTFFLFDRVPQDAGYHSFSDVKTYFSIPNTLNVLSNIPFLFVGISGLLSLRKSIRPALIVESNLLAYRILFFGVALTGVGSSYYHLSPSNETLVWDRLPMTLAFMALYSIIISEFVSEEKGKSLLFPLVFFGLCSVLYWWYTEQHEVGDLRYYAVVQFFPIFTIPIILLFFKSKYTSASGYWVLLGFYIIAKLFEHFDTQVHQSLMFVSGHSIKHVLPAIGLYILMENYRSRNLQAYRPPTILPSPL